MVDKRPGLRSNGMFAVHATPEFVRALDRHVSELGQTRSGFVRRVITAALLSGGAELTAAALDVRPRSPATHRTAEPRMQPVA